MVFSRYLSPKKPKKLGGNTYQRLKSSHSTPMPIRTFENSCGSTIKTETAGTIRNGDVVKLIRDSSKDSKWKDDEPFWHAYVQKVEQTPTGKGLRVLWLDAPSHTTCSTMHYPVRNRSCFCLIPVTVRNEIPYLSMRLFPRPRFLSSVALIILRQISLSVSNSPAKDIILQI